MNVRDVYKLSLVAALAVGAAVWSVNRAPGQADAEEGVEVLTRGPVHEAYAAIVTFDPEPGGLFEQIRGCILRPFQNAERFTIQENA